MIILKEETAITLCVFIAGISTFNFLISGYIVHQFYTLLYVEKSISNHLGKKIREINFPNSVKPIDTY